MSQEINADGSTMTTAEIRAKRNALSSEVTTRGRQLNDAITGTIQALDNFTHAYAELHFFDAVYVERYNKRMTSDAGCRLKQRLDVLNNVGDYVDTANDFIQTLHDIQAIFGYNDSE